MAELRNILSLFDGISCGRVALDRVGIKYEKYYASEIDKYAIAVARYNYPDTIFVGDIRNLKGKDFKNIDLIIGGSPCQNFSFAGKKQGMVTKTKIEVTTLEQYLELKEQGFEFEGQSYLFWEFVRLLKEIKPKWFLLENVKMAKKWRDIITNALKVEPVEINSALVSAQNRRRLYWTNIPIKGLPKDKGILLKDILEEKVDEKYYLSKEHFEAFLRNYKNFSLDNENGKSKPLLASYYKQPPHCPYILDREKSYCLTASYSKYPTLKDYFEKHRKQLIFEVNGKNKIKIRRLTPIECERLQTLPDNYTKYGLFEDGKVRKISDSQRYKMLGNAFTVDVVAWIFSFIKDA